MAAADVDVGSLSAHLGVPVETLDSITTDPDRRARQGRSAGGCRKNPKYNALYSERTDSQSLSSRPPFAIRKREPSTSRRPRAKALKDVESPTKLKDEGEHKPLSRRGPHLANTLNRASSTGTCD